MLTVTHINLGTVHVNPDHVLMAHEDDPYHQNRQPRAVLVLSNGKQLTLKEPLPAVKDLIDLETKGVTA